LSHCLKNLKIGIRVLPRETDHEQVTQWLKKEALLKFLGSQPSKTEEKHLLPKPEISLRFIWLFFEISFVTLFL